jgi:hypothetical protein
MAKCVATCVDLGGDRLPHKIWSSLCYVEMQNADGLWEINI